MKKRLIIFLLFFNFLLTFGQQENSKILGEFFGDYYYKLEADTGALLKGHEAYQTLKKNSNAFAIRRYNLGVDYNFNNNFTANLLIEGNDDFTLNSNRTRGVYIKYAYVTWDNFIKNINITFGLQRTPTFTILSEKVWGYRSIEKTITDFRKYASSSDMGISINGKIIKNINFHLMIANGEGTKIETNQFKRLYSSLYGSIFNDKLIYQLSFDFEKKDKSTNTSLTKFFAAYKNEKITLGIEPFLYTKEDTLITNDFGITTFVKNSIKKEKIYSFFRFDYYVENIDNLTTGYKELLGIAGIDYKPDKKISIMPNIWSIFYFKRSEIVINRKPDLFLRLTIHYKF